MGEERCLVVIRVYTVIEYRSLKTFKIEKADVSYLYSEWMWF